jgi:hypothetical protein
MVKGFLVGAAFVACASNAAYAYMAAAPVPVPVAFENGGLNPFAACAADAQERFVPYGPAFDAFMEKCNRTAAEHVCGVVATERGLTGKLRTSYTKKCVVEQIEAQR